MIHTGQEGGHSRDREITPGKRIEPPASAVPTPSHKSPLSHTSPPQTSTQVEVGRSLGQHPEPDLSASKTSHPDSLMGRIKRSRSRSTASLLLENLLATPVAAGLCYIASTQRRDFAAGLLAQPPVINIGGVLPMIAVVTFPVMSVMLWSASGVALIERGTKVLLKKLNKGRD
jgi:hypothetical protein